MSCDIPTFTSYLSLGDQIALGHTVSTASMHAEQARTLNPALKNCGKPNGCEICRRQTLGTDIKAMAKRVAANKAVTG